jgi:hypothetical protein
VTEQKEDTERSFTIAIDEDGAAGFQWQDEDFNKVQLVIPETVELDWNDLWGPAEQVKLISEEGGGG